MKASIIVVNYNGGELVEECIASLLAQRFREDYEIILVENCSTDGSGNKLKERFGDRLVWIENKENLGFARGCNQGIEKSRGEWIVLLNNDAVADPRWLFEIIRRGEESGDSIVCSKVVCYLERDILDNTGVCLYGDGMSRPRHRGRKDSSLFDGIGSALFSGSACAFRRDIIKDVEGFSEDFFAYSEDTDFCVRAMEYGHKVGYCSGAIVYHYISYSSSRLKGRKLFYAERNRIWLMIRHYPLKLILLSPVKSLFRYFFMFKEYLGGVKGALNLGFLEAFQQLIRAYLSAFWGIRKHLKARKIFKNSAEFGKIVEVLLREHKLSAREVARNF